MNPLLIYLFVTVMVIWGLIFVSKQPVEETFISGECPTTLIKDGNYYLVYDPTKAKIPGVNPIQLKSLEDYKEFVKWQRNSKLGCPILHYEKVYTTQGTEMYEIKPDFETNEGGVNHSVPEPISERCTDALLSHPPFNSNMFPAYDPQNQTEGNPGVMEQALL